MFTYTPLITGLIVAGSLMATTATAQQERSACQGLPSHQELRDALTAAQGQPNGGFNSGDVGDGRRSRRRRLRRRVQRSVRGDQWPGSRVISAQKANTANAFSLPGLALSTANLYTRCSRAAACSGCRRATR